MSDPLFFDANAKLQAFNPALSPFDIFGVPEQATQDAGALRKRWRELSRQLHPDRFQQGGGEEVARAEAWSSALNRAWKVLSDPAERIKAILLGKGIALGEGKVSQGFLMEMFEVNETIEEGELSPEERQETLTEIGSRIEQHQVGIAQLCSRLDEGAEPSTLVSELEGIEAEMRYLERLRKALL